MNSKKAKISISLILMLFIVVSCQETPERKFEKDGVSLIAPKGWEITEEGDIENQGYFLSIEKNGFSASGLLVITWLNTNVAIDEWMDMYKDKLRNNIVYRHSNLVFGAPYENEFNAMRTTSVNFTATIIGVKHEGVIHVFYEKDKTFAVLKQEATEDKIKNKKGFEIIEQSLIIE